MKGHNMKDETKEINKTPASSKRTAMRDMLTLNIIYKAADMMADNVPDEVREGTQPGTTAEEARERAEKAFCDCVNEIHGVMLKGLETVTQDEITKTMRYILNHDVGEQLAREGNRLREFYRSEEWAELKELFPELLEEDGASILFTGIYAPIIENLPELKQKIAEHEKQTGQKLTFLGLMDIEPKESLLKKFLQEIWGQDSAGTQTAINSVLNTLNMTVPNGKASNALARVSRKYQQEDPITRISSITVNGVTIKNGEPGALTLGIGAHKLLKTAEAELLQWNHYSRSKNAEPTTFRVAIPLYDYMLALNDNIKARKTNTPEEAQKEKNRINSLQKKLRKDIKKDLDTLHSVTLNFVEVVRGKEESFLDMDIISTKGIIRGGMICMTFNPDYAEYACKIPQSKYPKALLKIDSRSNNAYSMGIKLTEHYNMDNNVKKGTESRLKVDTLLKCTDLKSIEEIRRSRNSWQQRIKEPFENALDQLTGIIIKDWEYTHSKGIKLSKKEAYNITNFEDWENLYVDFVLLDPEDHTERRQRRQEEKEKWKQRRAKKPKKTKTGV